MRNFITITILQSKTNGVETRRYSQNKDGAHNKDKILHI